MRLRVLLPGILLFASSPALQAHAHLLEASPAEGSVLKGAPRELALRFSEPARLTRLTLEREGAAPEKISALPAQAQTRVVVPLPALLPPGRYRLSWRVLSADGHVLPGQLHFTLTQ